MKHSCYALLFLLLPVAVAQRASGRSVTFPCAGSIIALLDSAEAAAVSARPDAYTQEHTPFDLSIRMDKPSGVTEADYLAAAARDVHTWPADEEIQLREAFAAIEAFATTTGAHLHMPDTVKMIKTTASEEFGAEGYTREARIMLNTSAEPISLHLVAHELWHVISRYNVALRNNAYAAFHFRPCNNIVYKPALQNRVITNPDCPFLMHYITIEKDGAKQDVTLVLYSKEGYHAGYGLMQYISIGLLALTGDDAHKKPLLKDGKPVIYEVEKAPDFLKQVGMNTQYILHVEEITAEHFATLVAGEQLPQMEYVAGVQAALMK